MKRKLNGASLLLFITLSLLLPLSPPARASAQEGGKRDHLTAEEVELVRAAQIMVDEVLDWRVLFFDRPLVPPA